MGNEAKEMPLVSVVVITYNSEAFIVEALDSIKAQTYQNIELIISDDCSQDSTVSLCQEWIKENKSRFIDIKLLIAEQNTGITGNINRGCREARGEWIKPLAGDDLLIETCIEKNLANCLGRNIIFSRIEMFSDDKKLGFLPLEKNKYFFKLNEIEQFKTLFLNNVLPAPSSFIRRNFLIKHGFFDERYSSAEDIPFWLKATHSGEKIYYFDEITVRYRIHMNQFSYAENVVYNVKASELDKKLYTDYKDSKQVTKCLKFNKIFQLYIRKQVILGGNNLNHYSKNYKLLNYINPCAYVKKMKHVFQQSFLSKGNF